MKNAVAQTTRATESRAVSDASTAIAVNVGLLVTEESIIHRTYIDTALVPSQAISFS